MTTPTFDTIEAQASYGIGLQVGQQLSESGLEGLLPEALVAGIADALEGKHPAVPVDVVHHLLHTFIIIKFIGRKLLLQTMKNGRQVLQRT